MSGGYSPGGGGCPQTPWASNIDADQYSLLDVQDIQVERLMDQANDPVFSLFNQYIADSGNLPSISPEQRRLYNLSGNPVLSFQDSYLLDNSGTLSMDWCARSLYDNATSQSLEYNTRCLLGPSASTMLDWSGAALFAPSRIYIGGGADNGNDDIQLNASASVNFGQQIIQRLYTGNVLNFNNPAFTQSNACVSFWSQSDLTTPPANGNVLAWDSATETWAAAAAGSGSQTPWTQNIDADKFDLCFLNCLRFEDNNIENTGYHTLDIFNDATSWNFISGFTNDACCKPLHFEYCNRSFNLCEGANFSLCLNDTFCLSDNASASWNNFITCACQQHTNDVGQSAAFGVQSCGASVWSPLYCNGFIAGMNGCDVLRHYLCTYNDYYTFQDCLGGYSGIPCDLIFALNNGCTNGYTQIDFNGLGLGGVLNSNSGPLILAQCNTPALSSCAGYTEACCTWNFVGNVCAGGSSGYTGSFDPATVTQIDVFCGLITGVI